MIGVSTNSAERHASFQKEHSLPFPLASDESGAIAQAYGVPHTLGGVARVSFLVGAAGRVTKAFPAVDPAVHADEVLRAVSVR